MALTTFSPNTKIRSADVNANFAALAAGTDGTYSFDKVRVTKSANQSINDVTETSITWNQEDFDTNTMHDNSTNTNRITIQKTGYYLLAATLNFAGHTTDDTLRSFWFYRDNGDAIAGGSTSQDAGGTDSPLSVTAIYRLTAAQWVEIKAYQNSGVGLNILAARSHFSAALIP